MPDIATLNVATLIATIFSLVLMSVVLRCRRAFSLPRTPLAGC